MDALLLAARLSLTLVFAVAGIAKLFDLAGSRRAIQEFGIPKSLADTFGVRLPLTEIALSVTLLPVATAWWSALGMLILLLLFIGGISINLAKGRKPDCHCFGALHPAPAGWSTLARNGILTAVATLIVWQGQNNVGPSIINVLSVLTLAESLGLIFVVVIFGLLAAEGWFLIHLLRQNGRLLLRIETLEKRLAGENTHLAAMPVLGLPIGTPAPTFQLPGLHGETLTLDALRSLGKPLMLVFSDPDCAPCNMLMPEIALLQQQYASQLTIALISRGKIEANWAKSREHGLIYVLLQQNREVAEAYRTNGTPSGVIVGHDGIVESPLAQGADEIRNLVAQIIGTPSPATPPMRFPAPRGGCGNGNGHNLTTTTDTEVKIGKPAPALKLSDLSGGMVDLVDFQGNDTLILFWNPNCGYCRQMLQDLRNWESNPPEGAPQLLVVSTGTVEENQAMGLRSPIVLEQGFSAGYAFGASGTPSAVLIDAEGILASDIAVGASAVLALAHGSAPELLTTRTAPRDFK